MEAAQTKPGEAACSLLYPCLCVLNSRLALAEWFPPARLQIRPGETRVVSVLVLGLGRATRPR